MKNKIVLGKIGSGKTRGIIFPLVENIIKNNESFMVIDNKNEHIKRFYKELKEKEYNIVMIDLKDMEASDTFNPLIYPYKLYKEGKIDEAIVLLEKIGGEIFNPTEAIDPFWDNSARDIFIAMVIYLFKKSKEEEVNFNSVFNLLSLDNDDMICLFDDIKDTNAYVYACNILKAPKETKGGILSVALQKIKYYVSRDILSKFLSYNSFSIDHVDTKTAIFFANYDDSLMLNNISTMFIEEIYSMIKDKNVKYTFILDNFDYIENIIDFSCKISSSNDNNIEFIVASRSKELFIKKYDEYIFNLFDVIEINKKIELDSRSYDFIKQENKLKEVEIYKPNLTKIKKADELINLIDKKIVELEQEEI